MKALKIGNIKLKNRLFLAPMVEVTDLPYRVLCRRQGAAIAYTEMIYVDAILHENKKTLDMLRTSEEDKPIGIQVTGNNAGEFRKLSKLSLLRNFDLVDINCGCPSSRIVGNEAGSYLLKTPDKIGEMIKILKDSGLIVTAKIRLGFKNNNVMEVSKKINKAGADLLTIHARTAEQRSSEPADWKWISKVKNEIGIPVVGNGGIVDGKSAAVMLDIADGAMIAGAALGNPFVFREALRYLKTGKEKEVDYKEKIAAYLDYINLAKKYGLTDLARVKFLGGHFLRGFWGASKARWGLMGMKSVEDVVEFVGGIR